MSGFVFIIGVVLWILGAVAAITLAASTIGFFANRNDYNIYTDLHLKVKHLKKMKTCGNIAILALVLTPMCFVAAPFIHATVVTGHGEEAGYVTSVQVEGGVWPTPDLFFKTDTNNSETYKYCLPPGDDALYVEAQRLAEERAFVRIHYEERAWWHPWVCNNGPMIQSFEVLE